MKANEFIKNEGLTTAKDVVELCPLNTVEIHCNRLNVDYCFEKSELKGLIESHELVSKATPEELYQAEICEGIWCNHRLKQAIEDVESCMGEE